MQPADVGKSGETAPRVASFFPVGVDTAVGEKIAHGATQAATAGRTERAATRWRETAP